MKRCPQCQRSFDDTLLFCLDDGSPLPAAGFSERTMAASGAPPLSAPPFAYAPGPPAAPSRSNPLLWLGLGALVLLLVGGLIAAGIGAYYYQTRPSTLSYPDGTRYEGGVKDKKPDGHGVMKFSSGDVFEGEYSNGKRNGQGVFTFHDGSKYVGQFRDDNYDGQGVFTLRDGATYDGQFRNGVYDGQGTYTFSNGMRYVGHFKAGTYDGQGVLTFPGGQRQEGIWANGKLVEPSP